MSDNDNFIEFQKYIFIYSYNELMQKYESYFRQRFGNEKTRKIKERIRTSKTFDRMILASKTNRTYINEESIVGQLLLIPYFTFAGGHTQFLASLYALERWEKEVNRFTNVMSEIDLKDTIISIFTYIQRIRGIPLE